MKAVSPDQNPDSPRILRREIEVTRRLPASVPAPPLVAVLDDGHWIVGVFEFVDGRPPADPWERDELDAVIAAMAALPDRTTSELRSFLAPAAEQPAGAPDAARVPAGAGRGDAAVAPLPARRPGAAVALRP